MILGKIACQDEGNDIRIDLVQVVNGILTFVELKRLDDTRMLKKTEEIPEEFYQLKGYEEFLDIH